MRKIQNIFINDYTFIRDVIPYRLPRIEISDYLKSKTYKNKFELLVQRRHFILGMAAVTSSVVFPRAPARASGKAEIILELIKGTLEVGVSGVELIKDTYEIYEKTRGTAQIENADETHSAKGNIMLAVVNERNEVESSAGFHFQVPRATTNNLHFNAGPAAREEGSKELWVLGSDEGDYADFEAQKA